jgi:hypothetical protein
MTAIAYSAKRDRIHLRVVAYHPSMEPMPDDHLRVVVQVVEHGRPIAVDPIHTEQMSALEFARAMHISRNEGWEVEPWEDRRGR